MDRVPSGIRGLDELIEGGLPKGDTTLLTGTPGTAKSTFALEYLVNGAQKHGDRGLYISLEDREVRTIQERAIRFGWNLPELVEQNKLMVLIPEIKPEFGEDPIEWINDERVQRQIKQFNPQRVAIDSLSLLLQYSKDTGGARRNVQMILDSFRLGATTLFVHERETGELDNIHYTIEEFIADGIIYLQYIRRGNLFRRSITILKMRGTKHSTGVYPFNVEDGEGIIVYPAEKLF